MMDDFRSFVRTHFSSPELQCIDSGYVDLDTNWQSQNVCSPYARLYFIQAGSGVLTENGREICMQPGRAYLVPTGVRFDYRCSHRLVKLYFHLNLIADDGRDILRHLESIRGLEVSAGDIEDLEALCKTQTLPDALRLRQIVTGTLGRLLRLYPADALSQPVYSPFVRQIIDYVRENLSVRLTAADIAKSLFIAESTLHKAFKQETGTALGQYIDSLILFNAQLLLVKTDRSIKDISEQLGFCDQFYFSRRFKAVFGQPPLLYRKLAKRTETL